MNECHISTDPDLTILANASNILGKEGVGYKLSIATTVYFP